MKKHKLEVDMGRIDFRQNRTNLQYPHSDIEDESTIKFTGSRLQFAQYVDTKYLVRVGS